MLENSLHPPQRGRYAESGSAVLFIWPHNRMLGPGYEQASEFPLRPLDQALSVEMRERSISLGGEMLARNFGEFTGLFASTCPLSAAVPIFESGRILDLGH
jgi:hypothetical protein